MQGNSIVVVYQQSCLLAGVNADFHLGISIAIFSTTRLESNGRMQYSCHNDRGRCLCGFPPHCNLKES